jgi:hypothetical protein
MDGPHTWRAWRGKNYNSIWQEKTPTFFVDETVIYEYE